MKIFFDTEFIDLGKTVHLLSIGMVREDGKQYYAEDAETDRSLAGEWVQKNVIPHLTGPAKPRDQIAEEIRRFVNAKQHDRPQFWGYYPSYDWLVLCSLYGNMLGVPEHWPNHPMDVQQLRVMMNVKALPEMNKEQRHNALYDAHWTRQAYDYLKHLNNQGVLAYP